MGSFRDANERFGAVNEWWRLNACFLPFNKRVCAASDKIFAISIRLNLRAPNSYKKRNEMGNVRSNVDNTTAFSDDPFWNPQSLRERPRMSNSEVEATDATGSDSREVHREQLQRNLVEFKQELERKHEKRRELIAKKRREFQELRDEVQALCAENEVLKGYPTGQHPAINLQSQQEVTAQLKDENEELKLQVEKLKIQLKDSEEVNAKNKELRLAVSEMQLDLQKLNSEMLNIEQERAEYAKHIRALKDVIKVTKDMLEIREAQIHGLKAKVTSVEELLASKEMKIMSDGLREEYERQLRNIRNLRTLYEERQRLEKIEKEHLQMQLEETKKKVENEQTISSDRLQRIEELEKDNSEKYDQINNLQSTMGLKKAECMELQAEIDVINQLFSQILLGFNNSQEIDLDKLIKRLEENHDLLTDIASNEESHSTAAALPKVLLDLINQINNEKQTVKPLTEEDDSNVGESHQLNSPEEIVETLPKVWKVLIELLSHQNPPLSALKDGEKDPCYKSVETPTGPKLKLSVSQTFIRLKDLIIEKRFLEREMYRLKHLNTHLEGRLQDQEKRLELVSGELSTTWRVVEKMQRQHQQLHTHEKVLRYELHEKRKLLTGLKEELAYCREKWVQAREKNDSTQEQWKELRKEFAARKTQPDDFNQSAESGYSDDKDSSEDDEKGYESDVSEGKRESDCDADCVENAPPSSELHCEEGRQQFRGEGGNNEMAIITDCAQNVDGIRSDGSHHQMSADEANLEDVASNHQELRVGISAKLENATGANQFEETGEINISTNEKTNIEQRLEDCSVRSNEKTDLQSSSSPSVGKEGKCDENGLEGFQQEPSCSSQTTPARRTPEELFAAREERLRRLEEESSKLIQKVTNTQLRSSDISNKLDNLHEIYGETSSAESSRSTHDEDSTERDENELPDKTEDTT